jgi:hypothetical protein
LAINHEKETTKRESPKELQRTIPVLIQLGRWRLERYLGIGFERVQVGVTETISGQCGQL